MLRRATGIRCRVWFRTLFSDTALEVVSSDAHKTEERLTNGVVDDQKVSRGTEGLKPVPRKNPRRQVLTANAITRRSKYQFDGGREYTLDEALAHVRAASWADFDEAVDVVIRLNLDPRKADQNLRGVVDLPFGSGKLVRVAVFARGDKAKEALEAGAELVGAEDLIDLVRKGELNFQRVVATPELMPLVARVGKILGPRGLMPNPKLGTVTLDVADAVQKMKAGQIQFRTDSYGNMHAAVGRISFPDQQLLDNLAAFTRKLMELKPEVIKRRYIVSSALSSTMGPGVRVQIVSLLQNAGLSRPSP
mmetsp:Transcript_14773/g.30049  ORF Transcript_14773/g.30049 Transcript_14773/m.30049 type:complete len:306 (-) Transcript_14773:1485-2402(-)